MFDISWGELVLIGMVALIVIGPKELPTVLRTLGQYMTKIRRMASEFQGQFNEAMREAEMADLKSQVDDVAKAAKSFDPLSTVRNEFDSVFKDATVNGADLTPSSTPTTPTPDIGGSITPPEAAPVNPAEFAPLDPSTGTPPTIAEPAPAQEPHPEPHPERAALDGAPAVAPEPAQAPEPPKAGSAA